MKRTQPILNTVCGLCAVLLLFTPAAAQKAQNKFTDAIERSGHAGRLVELLARVHEGDLPKELIEKAEAVGVFPKVEKQSALFSQITHGYGVISARAGGGWTMPAFYQFGGSGFANPFSKNDTFGVIFLFMTKDAVAAFEKGGFELKGERKALPGPVGALTDEQRKELEGAHILAYAYYNGVLKGTSFGKSFWKNFILNPDNKINKPLYGLKGREVLAGKEPSTATFPDGIPAYREALQKYYGTKGQAPAAAQ